MAFEREQIAGRRLARDNPADVEREVGEARETRALGVEMPELEPPAVPLTAGVLARDAVEPAFDTARQGEVGRVDRQHQPPVEDALVEPLGSRTNSMPSQRPTRVVSSSHSLIQENCWRRQCSP